MEPVFTVEQQPPVLPPHQPGQMMQVQHQHGGGWRRPVRCALLVAVFLAVTGNFAFAAYRARHRGRDLAFVLVTYFLFFSKDYSDRCCGGELGRGQQADAAGRRPAMAPVAVHEPLSPEEKV